MQLKLEKSVLPSYRQDVQIKKDEAGKSVSITDHVNEAQNEAVSQLSLIQLPTCNRTRWKSLLLASMPQDKGVKPEETVQSCVAVDK